MNLVSGRELLAEANRGGYALGAFNFNNLEFLQAICAAAEDTHSPVFLATTEGAIRYAGLENIVALARTAAAHASVPLCLHLDHGRDLTLIQRCLEMGYTSVMIDASDLPFAENVARTKLVVAMARKTGAAVEAELGRLVGTEDTVTVAERDAVLIDPEQAAVFVKETGVDSLAPAIGTSHGAFKFRGEPQLDFARLQQVKETTGGLPLVLHGASSVPRPVIQRCLDSGMKLSGASGVPEEQLLRAITLGINKVNVDTDLRLSFTAEIRHHLGKHPEKFDPRDYLGLARDAVRQLVAEKIRLFRSVARQSA